MVELALQQREVFLDAAVYRLEAPDEALEEVEALLETLGLSGVLTTQPLDEVGQIPLVRHGFPPRALLTCAGLGVAHVQAA